MDASRSLPSSLPQGHRLRYRGDIEGLRAVAILLVVAAHAGVEALPGGFIGVDVFFVLSGYLITGLLLKEAEGTGAIHFAGFYARRFRRLLPALLSMLVCTFAASLLLVAPTDQPGQAIAGATAALWVSNFYFAFAALDYFGPAADTNLFLHTWSLGVEEQFYLLWPLLILVVLRRRPGDAQAGRRQLQAAMGLLLAVSLVYCILSTPRQPQLAFYLVPTRAWQFALGGLAFLYVGRESSDAGGASRPSAVPSLSGWLGLVMVVGSAVWLNTSTPYPGVLAMLPSIGAALILAAGATEAGGYGVARVLSLGPMQGIGRVSYAWYLWHWPTLLLGATVIDTVPAINRLLLVAVSFGLAVLSARFVEEPIRRGARWLGSPGSILKSGLAAAAMTAVVALVWNGGAARRVAAPDFARVMRARSEVPAIYGMGCDEWFRSAEVRVCYFGRQDAEHTAVAMGDSIGLQWFPAMAYAFDRPGWRLLVVTKSSCPMVDKPFFYERIGREYTECTQWRDAALAYVASLEADAVILGSSATYDFAEDDWIEGTARVLKVLSESAESVYLLRATPMLPFDGPGCLEPRSVLHTWLAGAQSCSASAQNARADDVGRWLAAAAGRFSNVRLVDLNDAVCPLGTCNAERAGTVVFRDSQHLTAEFAGSLGHELAARVGFE